MNHRHAPQVRDGRDMSFHWLQSPVKRYWPALFPQHFSALPPSQRGGSNLIPDHGSYEGKAYIYDVPRLGAPKQLNMVGHAVGSIMG